MTLSSPSVSCNIKCTCITRFLVLTALSPYQPAKLANTEDKSAKKAFVKIANVLGYGNPKEIADRCAFNLCISRSVHWQSWWRKCILDEWWAQLTLILYVLFVVMAWFIIKPECHLLPAFQSWFIIANLHIWLLTVCLCALPSPHGTYFIEALINHFSLNIEDQICSVLQPGLFPEPFKTYQWEWKTQNVCTQTASDKADENNLRTVEWDMVLDLGLVKGDTEMVGAVWQNLLGTRGVQRIVLPGN